MAELLLLTSDFPHRVEFLDQEIVHLAQQFDVVTVVPLRPSGEPVVELPPNVTVDYSLARALDPQWAIAGRYSRQLAAVGHAVGSVRTKMPTGAPALHRAWTSKPFLRDSFRMRADTEAIRRWASDRHPPDLAYTFWLGPNALAFRWAWPNVPLVSRTHRHDLYPEAHNYPIYPYQHLVVEEVDLIASVSDDGARYLQRMYPQEAAHIVVRRLGIADIGGLAHPDPGSTVRLLSVSHMHPVKRVPLIAETVVGLAQAGTKVHWTHLGTGPELAQVQDILASAPPGFSSDLPGFAAQAEVYDTMRNGGFHAFVNLSLSEGAPVSIMEAQCVGLPVLATNVGGTHEVADPTLNRLVNVTDSTASLIMALRDLVENDPGDSQARRQRWHERYDAAVNYPQWAQELRALASPR